MDIYETNIFGKKLSEVNVEDIKNFCDKQTREGINLDYKKDLSSSKTLAKTIASMANTLGGWIIIGVDDDKKSDKPKLPVEGIDFKKQLSLEVTNIVIDNISPPSLPIIHVCEPDKNNKTFIVLYVQESPEAPHWLFNENKLCIRLSDRSSSTEWERLASANEWEFLRNKRQRAQKLYNQQKDELDILFYNYDHKSKLNKSFKNTNLFTPNTSFEPDPETKDKLNITISPKYPTQELFSVEDSIEIISSIKFRDHYGTGTYFPNEAGDLFLFQNGAHTYFNSDDYIEDSDDDNRKLISFFALNKFGMFSFKENIIFKNEKETGVFDSKVFLDQLLVKFKQNLIFAKNLYEKINYLGIITINTFVSGESWMCLGSASDGFFGSAFKLKSPNPNILFNIDTSLIELNDELKMTKIVQKFYDEIANSFRWDPMRRVKLEDILKPFNL